LRAFFPSQLRQVVPDGTRERPWMGYFRFQELVHHGVTCRRNSVRGKRLGGRSTNGTEMERSARLCTVCVVLLSTSARSIKTCGVSTGPLFELLVVLQAVKKGNPEEPADHALGRSQEEFSTKSHILCDGYGHPLHFHLTSGQAHESTVLDTLLDGEEESLLDSEDKRIAWPFVLGGDIGYRADWIDEYLLELASA